MGIILSFLSANWRTVGTLLIVCSAFITAGVYRGMYHHEKDALAALEQLTEAQKKANEAHAQQVEIQQKEISDATVKSYQKKLADLRAYYAKHPVIRLPIPSGQTCPVPDSKTADGTSEAAKGTAETPAELDVEKAGEEVLQCQQLIDWVQHQGSVK